MTVGNLESVEFNDIVTCFLESFQNYFVEMPADPGYYRQRWQSAKVDMEYSYGMFEEDKLVGFVLHAIDTRNGMLTAFNAGTGVLPAFRRKRIVQRIYEYAIPALRQIHVARCNLEVITENNKAIAAYERVGFKIIKKYKCFRGVLKPVHAMQVALNEISFENSPWYEIPNRDFYSWENHEASIKKGPYKFYQVLFNGVPESFFIINVTNGYVAQLDVLVENDFGWDRLFKGISQVATHIRINNVDDQLTIKTSEIIKAGLENHIDQYEMQMQL